MSLNPVKVWHRTPEKMANYVPGMDLGEPDKIVQPEPMAYKGLISPIVMSGGEARFNKDRKRSGPKPRMTISKEDYLKLRLSGQTRQEIAKSNNLAFESFINYLRKWKISKLEDERAAMEGME